MRDPLHLTEILIIALAFVLLDRTEFMTFSGLTLGFTLINHAIDWLIAKRKAQTSTQSQEPIA